jgi:hypothetical protein
LLCFIAMPRAKQKSSDKREHQAPRTVATHGGPRDSSEDELPRESDGTVDEEMELDTERYEPAGKR